MPGHECFAMFWGDALTLYSEWLVLIAPGDARRMKVETYLTFCAVQREIERSTNRPPSPILPHIGGGTTWTDSDESLFRCLGQTFMDGLVADQFDVGPGQHTPIVMGWILTGSPETPPPHNALVELVGILPSPSSGGLLGKVKNVLGP